MFVSEKDSPNNLEPLKSALNYSLRLTFYLKTGFSLLIFYIFVIKYHRVAGYVVSLKTYSMNFFGMFFLHEDNLNVRGFLYLYSC